MVPIAFSYEPQLIGVQCCAYMVQVIEFVATISRIATLGDVSGNVLSFGPNHLRRASPTYRHADVEPMKPDLNPQPLVYSLAQLPRVIGMGATTVNKLLKSGELPSRKIGHRTVVLRTDAEKYLASLPVRVPVIAMPAADTSLPSVADDPRNPSPLDRILDLAMHAELAALRDPSRGNSTLVEAVATVPEAGEDI